MLLRLLVTLLSVCFRSWMGLLVWLLVACVRVCAFVSARHVAQCVLPLMDGLAHVAARRVRPCVCFRDRSEKAVCFACASAPQCP